MIRCCSRRRRFAQFRSRFVHARFDDRRRRVQVREQHRVARFDERLDVTLVRSSRLEVPKRKYINNYLFIYLVFFTCCFSFHVLNSRHVVNVNLPVQVSAPAP